MSSMGTGVGLHDKGGDTSPMHIMTNISARWSELLVSSSLVHRRHFMPSVLASLVGPIFSRILQRVFKMDHLLKRATVMMT